MFKFFKNITRHSSRMWTSEQYQEAEMAGVLLTNCINVYKSMIKFKDYLKTHSSGCI